VITGANSGLGFETALALARKNATVVMVCRSFERGCDARDSVREQAPDAQLDMRILDLASLQSIRAFAESFLASYDRLDMLFNNAGMMATPRWETEDGFEMQFGVNHLGHFALTGLLLPALLQTPGSRVVTVTSWGAYFGRIDFDNLVKPQWYNRYVAYNRSKLANLLFAVEFQRLLTAAGANTLSLAANPGLAETKLQQNTVDNSDSRLERLIYRTVLPLFAHSQYMGSLPQLYAATMPDVRPGGFYSTSLLHIRGYPVLASTPEVARDEAVADQLWQVSRELTGVTYDGLTRAEAPR
jgi:NAD(P)-dependent dehydrogenase (short-subunit alcohol dehydrogenase family)